MHPIQRGATARGLDPMGHGADRAAPREGASKRERGGDQFETQRLLLLIYKREGGVEILDPSYRRQNFTFILKNLSKRQTEEGTPYM